MKRVLSALESRKLDRYFIDECGMHGLVLMEQASIAVFHHITKLINTQQSILIVCGSGNNGGDGLALLRILCTFGYNAKAIVINNGKCFSNDARTNLSIAQNCSLPIYIVSDPAEFDKVLNKDHDMIVDAVFGTGLTRNVEGIYKHALLRMNNAAGIKVAIDMPSGIDSDTGRICGYAFIADETITFQTQKRGQLLYPGREHCGNTTVYPIGVLKPDYEYGSNEFIATDEDFKSALPIKKPDAHKGNSGRLLIIAGSKYLRGAAVINAKAALKSGAGLVRVLCPECICEAFSNLPEAMLVPIQGDWDSLHKDVLKDQLQWADAIAIGSGMGKNPSVFDIAMLVSGSNKPCVMDADALNAFAARGIIPSGKHIILTPHVGEMARLCSDTTKNISENLQKFALDFVSQHDVNLVLKSATTIIASKSRLIYNIKGGCELAKGGSGDILCGIIGSFLAQGMAPSDAAWAAPYLLGMSSNEGMKLLITRMPIASDIIDAFVL
ncbi:MAG: NAD(P)H-hydrate dehydratase [Clostridia bacterium]|nr:NAD(P)H-hydrate dehydratase [Clostridia bacterium]